MSQSNEPIAPTARATAALPYHGSIRRVIDEQGVLWKIFERPNNFDRHMGWSLVFESESVVRSVRNYPSDWYAIEASELIELRS